MAISFKILCAQININPDKAGEDQLNVLEKWCHEHISSDVHYSGTFQEKYKKYITLAQNYLDDFLVNLPKDYSEPSQFAGMNAIQYAAYQGYDHYLKSLKISTGLWSQRNNDGMTPLHLAAAEGHEKTVKVLLSKGADANQLNRNNQMPIYSALMVPVLYDEGLIERKKAIFNSLYEKTEKISSHKDISGETVLHLIAEHDFVDLAKKLLKKNEKIACIENNSHEYPIHTALLNGSDRVAVALLNTDKVITQIGDKNQTILHYAASYASIDILALCCCSKKVDLNAKDRDGNTALILAAQAEKTDAVQLLVAKGADVSCENSQDYSVLHYAVESGNKNLVNWLLSHAHLDKMDPHGTILSVADSEMHSLLVDNGAKTIGFRA